MNTRVYVSVMITDESGKILLLKRSESSQFAPGEWEFINGSIDPGETAEQAAIREISEETGIVVEPSSLIWGDSFETTDADGRWVVIPYKVSTTSTVVSLSDEHSESQWVTLNELSGIPYVCSDYNRMKFEA